MRQLIDGIERFERDLRSRYKERFAELAQGQSPFALFLACSDSRVVPSLLTASQPGDLFVVRNVANLVPPAPRDPGAAESLSVPAAINYAVETLGVSEIIVCGHSRCGGIQAVIDGSVSDPYTSRWLELTRPAVRRWRNEGPLDASLPSVDQLSQWSTLVQMENLKTYPAVRRGLERGDLRTHALWFDIAEGRMLGYSHGERRFVRASDALSQEVLSA